MAEFALLCPGQGSQSPEMFDFALGHSRGREVIEAFEATLGLGLVARARANERLFDNTFAQPALVAVALANWAVLAPDLPSPLLFAGYSVGEVSAWGCAGAWDAAWCARVAAERARLMDADSPADCGMLAVRGLRHEELVVLASSLHVAIINDPHHLVLAGKLADIELADGSLTAHGATTRRLDVRVPSHTPLLAGACRALGQFLQSVPMRDVPVPVLRGIDGLALRHGAQGKLALEQAVSHTIRWDLCQRTIAESGVRVLLELGPGRSLTKISADQETESLIVGRSIADFRSADGIARWLERQLEQ